MVLGALQAAGKFLGAAAPLLSFGAAISGGGQRQTLQRAATAASGLNRPMGTQQGQSTAVDQAQAPASETAASGEAGGGSVINVIGQQPQLTPAAYGGRAALPPMRPSITPASVPAVVGGAVQVGRGFLGPFLAGTAGAMLAPIIIDPFTGEEKKLRVTRRLRSQVRRAVEMFGVDQVAAQMGLDAEAIFYILTKKMRNDGPYVTKAAVRKTRQTVRKMKHLCDMYDDLRPPARRAPARRTATKTTLIKN